MKKSRRSIFVPDWSDLTAQDRRQLRSVSSRIVQFVYLPLLFVLAVQMFFLQGGEFCSCGVGLLVLGHLLVFRTARFLKDCRYATAGMSPFRRQCNEVLAVVVAIFVGGVLCSLDLGVQSMICRERSDYRAAAFCAEIGATICSPFFKPGQGAFLTYARLDYLALGETEKAQRCLNVLEKLSAELKPR